MRCEIPHPCSGSSASVFKINISSVPCTSVADVSVTVAPRAGPSEKRNRPAWPPQNPFLLFVERSLRPSSRLPREGPLQKTIQNRKSFVLSTGKHTGKLFPVSPPLLYNPSHTESPRLVGSPMLLTELNGPRSFQPRPARSRRFSSSFRLSLAAILLFTGLAAGAGSASAQAQQQQQNEPDQQQPSVAEAARQERARKQEQQKTARHVYTDEDLKRSRILTPQDQAAVEARKTECARNPQKNNCAPSASQNPGALDANSRQPSLGEVARQYRKQKELQALRPKQSQPFRLAIGNSALASPIVPGHPALRPPTPPVLASGVRNSESHATAAHTSEVHANLSRRDPFAPVPARPRVPFDGASQFRPAARPSAKMISPTAPKISAAPMPPAKLFGQPSQPAPVAAPPQPENSPKRSTFVFEPTRPRVKKSLQPKNASSLTPPTFVPAPAQFVPVPQAQPVRPALQLQPVRPVLPSNQLRQLSPTLPANLFRAPKFFSPLDATETRPAAPTAPERVTPPPASVETRSINSGSLVAPLPPSQPLIHPASPAPSAAHPLLPALSSPISSTARTVRVQSGDSLWRLARQNLGRGARWTQLRAANPAIADPNRLPVGIQLLLPGPAVVSSVVPGPARHQDLEQIAQTTPSSTLRVRHGDTLWSLAKQFLGNPAVWPCLAAANPSIANPDRIFAGQQLLLPSGCQKPSRK
jgi:nucleoid-associated protein YgaU